MDGVVDVLLEPHRSLCERSVHRQRHGRTMTSWTDAAAGTGVPTLNVVCAGAPAPAAAALCCMGKMSAPGLQDVQLHVRALEQYGGPHGW